MSDIRFSIDADERLSEHVASFAAIVVGEAERRGLRPVSLETTAQSRSWRFTDEPIRPAPAMDHWRCECGRRRHVLRGHVAPSCCGGRTRYVLCGGVEVPELDNGPCATDVCPRCGACEEHLGDHEPRRWEAWA